jgi:hypothetical protein
MTHFPFVNMDMLLVLSILSSTLKQYDNDSRMTCISLFFQKIGVIRTNSVANGGNKTLIF